MDYEYEELLAAADIAFGNRQYPAAMELYVKALTFRPDDLYLLSRAGITGIASGRYKDAFNFFSRAVELDPGNGDNYYNLGNAYYYRKDYGKCLELYTQAEQIGCSPEVVKKLYFQKALLCSARGDVKAALVYLNKYEAACGSDLTAIDPRIFSEKVKLHLILEDYEKAESCAAKLVTLQPTVLMNYLMYFGVLMVLKKYETAERVLRDAEDFAVSTAEDRYIVRGRKAAFYAELSKVYAADAERSGMYFEEAQEIYEGLLKETAGKEAQSDVKLDAALMYMQAKKYDEALDLLLKTLPAERIVPDTAEETPAEPPEEKPSAARYSGSTLSSAGKYSYGMSSAVGYGTRNPVKKAAGDSAAEEETKAEASEETAGTLLSGDALERTCYVIMSCYIAKEDYRNALPYARRLKESRTEDYRYFAIYCEAFAMRSLAEEDADRLYAEAISFYRSEMIRNPKNRYAIVYRARLYAEQGSFARAEEMAKLLSPEEQAALLEYFGKCRE